MRLTTTVCVALIISHNRMQYTILVFQLQYGSQNTVFIHLMGIRMPQWPQRIEHLSFSF